MSPGSAASHDHHEVPGHDLAQAGNGQDPGGPPRVVAREGSDDVDVRTRPGPPERRPDGDREQRLAEPVLRLAPVPAAVATAGTVAAEVVPRSRLVAAPGRQPWSERQEDRAPWPGHSPHLGGHRPPGAGALPGGGRETDVDGPPPGPGGPP